MEITMRGSDGSPACWKTAGLAALAMFLLAATPLAATESEIKAQAAKAEDSEAETAAEAPQAEATAESDVSVCIDAADGQTSPVNTLEDIFSLSRGNVAAMLQLTAPPAAEEKTAPAEVRWTEVKTTADSASSAQEKKQD